MGFEGNIEVNVLDNRKSFRVGSLWTGSYCERVKANLLANDNYHLLLAEKILKTYLFRFDILFGNIGLTFS